MGAAEAEAVAVKAGLGVSHLGDTEETEAKAHGGRKRAGGLVGRHSPQGKDNFVA